MCNTCAKQPTCKTREIKESLEPINCKDKITYVSAGILEQPERRRDDG